MLILIRESIKEEEIIKIVEDFDGYIKLVVDVDKEIMTGGGKRHVEGEQLLLNKGSKQENLWGGGIDKQTKEIDYNSIINLRPRQNNPSRDILSEEIRAKFDTIVHKLLF
ncbi:hypothetical protein A3C23_05510 [Candidatus Roizmanbacteria bacterium RIFCSPHIGHO2_02_FULL_37_13b]|uniref:Uncharacterized protein n=1 Tax=Candidatus Roizmanbacteria bacterium RIFCSPLOWO2_02_FULL_36_11 TaxID=1802071 RepID=A0A1F7JCG8_9BACT|nr:MAG: hypothetical protein A3C23_05510 [Candidatus Roizmanbacteria bacterium RIFCSPHIGHO2_02_FULL_37_13b]OGK53301.1 MAG: hypothetical protein A3H78_03280 [Candidatus Roizmanbacteria bacterium RIFCSPLOWO2_02_FULL_36_11]